MLSSANDGLIIAWSSGGIKHDVISVSNLVVIWLTLLCHAYQPIWSLGTYTTPIHILSGWDGCNCESSKNKINRILKQSSAYCFLFEGDLSKASYLQTLRFLKPHLVIPSSATCIQKLIPVMHAMFLWESMISFDMYGVRYLMHFSDDISLSIFYPPTVDIILLQIRSPVYSMTINPRRQQLVCGMNARICAFSLDPGEWFNLQVVIF